MYSTIFCTAQLIFLHFFLYDLLLALVLHLLSIFKSVCLCFYYSFVLLASTAFILFMICSINMGTNELLQVLILFAMCFSRFLTVFQLNFSIFHIDIGTNYC